MVPICKKIRSKSISISRKIIINTYLVWEDHSILLWVVFFLNNKIIIVWGRQTHPQLPADGSVTVKVTFPISFTNTSYNICHSFIADAGSTARTRIRGVGNYKTSSIDVYFWSESYTTGTNGKFSYHIIGF